MSNEWRSERRGGSRVIRKGEEKKREEEKKEKLIKKLDRKTGKGRKKEKE